MKLNVLIQTYLDYLARMGKKSVCQTSSHATRLLAVKGDVSSFSVIGYQDKRRKEGASDTTINRECEVLSCAARHWKRTNGVEVVLGHIPRFTENNARQGFFEKEEYERLLLHLDPRLSLFTQWAYHTGWRFGEIASMTWDMVHDGSIYLPDTKNGKPRVIPIAGPLTAIIEKVRLNKGNSLIVFHDLNGNRFTDIRRYWQKACVAANIQGRLFHDFRRTAARNMIARGVDREIAKRITGHKTDSMFNRYMIVDQRQMTAALEG